ncbi:hypothetical protein LSAT2_028579 [Lamellibrachia satsuma]|nr:hypothetical protein LSAT2_028579 [Lamellibrachia satsuma]
MQLTDAGNRSTAMTMTSTSRHQIISRHVQGSFASVYRRRPRGRAQRRMRREVVWLTRRETVRHLAAVAAVNTIHHLQR